MYPNVKAEMARKNLTLETIVKRLQERGSKITIANLSLKLNGKTKLTLKEAKALKSVIETDVPLEKLFEEAV